MNQKGCKKKSAILEFPWKEENLRNVGVLSEIQNRFFLNMDGELLLQLTSNSFHCSTKPLSVFATVIFINALKRRATAEAVGCSPSLHII